MRRIAGCVCVFLVGALAAAVPARLNAALKSKSDSGCVHSDDELRCVAFVNNYDGDTITVEIPGVHALLGREAKVRVRGIDTPEVKGKSPCEKDAARAARNLVEAELKRAQRIDLKHVEKDKYFRILADVSYDGKDLREILIKNRLANPYDGGTKAKTDWCEFMRRKAAP